MRLGQEICFKKYDKLHLTAAERKIVELGWLKKAPQKISASYNGIVKTYGGFAKDAKTAGGRYRFSAPLEHGLVFLLVQSRAER